MNELIHYRDAYTLEQCTYTFISYIKLLSASISCILIISTLFMRNTVAPGLYTNLYLGTRLIYLGIGPGWPGPGYATGTDYQTRLIVQTSHRITSKGLMQNFYLYHGTYKVQKY